MRYLTKAISVFLLAQLVGCVDGTSKEKTGGKNGGKPFDRSSSGYWQSSSASSVGPDTDGDGYPDAHDAFPLDPLEWLDSDRDGVGDKADPTPLGEAFPVWNTFQGNNSRTGFVPVTVDTTDFSSRWQAMFGHQSDSSPVHAQGAAGDGFIFVSTGNRLVAWRAHSNYELWDHLISANTPPVYADGRVYAASNDYGKNALWTLDAATGTRLSKHSLADLWSQYHAPTLVDGALLFAGAETGGIYSVDASTGQTNWWNSLQNKVVSAPTVSDDQVFVLTGDPDARLTVIDRRTGELVAAIADEAVMESTDQESLISQSAPVHDGDSVVAIYRERIIHFDVKNQRKAWSVDGAFSGQPVIAGDRVYAMNAGKIDAYDLATGALIKTFSGATAYTGNFLITKNLLFVFGKLAPEVSGTDIYKSAVVDLHAVELATADVLWTRKTSSGAMFMADDALLIHSPGSLVAIELTGDRDGDQLPDWWEKGFGQNLDAAADPDADGLTNLQEFRLNIDPFNADTDGDGLSDGDEVNNHRTDPLQQDSDGDGLTDHAEIQVHRTDPRWHDSDWDGLADGEELAMGFNPSNADDATADNDGDGVHNRYEWMAGTAMDDALSVPAAGDWGMAQGNALHNGYQPIALRSYNFGVAWQKTFAVAPNALATGGGRVFISFAKEDEGVELVAFAADTGAEQWVRLFATADHISAPSYADGRVYVYTSGDEDVLVSVDAQTGEEIFCVTYGAGGPVEVAPTVAHGVTLVSSGFDGGVVALNAATGQSLWTGAGLWTDLFAPAITADSIYLTRDNGLAVLALSDGSERGFITTDITQPVPVLGGRNNVILIDNDEIKNLDLATGQVKWSAPKRAPRGLVAAGNGRVYANTNVGLVSFDESTGRRIWGSASPYVTVGQNDASAHNVVVTLTHVFVANEEEVFGYSVDTGSLIWNLKVGGQLALGADHTLYILNGQQLTAVSLGEFQAR